MIKKNTSKSLSGARFSSRNSVALISLIVVLLAVSTLKSFQSLPPSSYLPSYTSNIYSINKSDGNDTQMMEEQIQGLLYRYKYLYMYNQRRTLVNESSAMVMGFQEKERIGSRFVQDYFGSELELLKSWRNEVSKWNATERNK